MNIESKQSGNDSGKESEKKSGQKTDRVELREAKIDSYLSNERTFLTWIRTSLAAMILGFLIARFGFWFDEITLSNSNLKPNNTNSMIAMISGISIIFLAAVTTVLAIFRFREIDKIIQKGSGKVNDRIIVFSTIAILAIAAILVIYLLLVSRTFQK